MPAPVPYHLGKFPPQGLDADELSPLITQANIQLARYDAILSVTPGAGTLLSPLTTKEAVLSSKIEGTHVTLGEVLEVEAGGTPENDTPERREDFFEVLNYKNTIRMCEKKLLEQPLTQHFIREAHAMLMQGVRGQDKTPGQYRSMQNWIGRPRCKIEEAEFIPVPAEHLAAGMDAWEGYLNADNPRPDPVVRLAILHVEFEALHPFCDGNGRLGRMLIPLYLYQKGLLNKPNFYMSEYFEENRDAYLDKLRRVSSEGAWTQWCVFFLGGIAEQAKINEDKARQIIDLHSRTQEQALEATKSQHVRRSVQFMFEIPVFNKAGFIAATNMPAPSATRILQAFQDAGILRLLRPSSGRRSGLFIFPELLNTAEGANIF